MEYEILVVNADQVTTYINQCDESSQDPWIQSVVDIDTVRMMMLNGKHGRERKGYGIFLGGDLMIGYAVIHTPTKHLDLLHIDEDFRGRGVGEQFLRQLDIETVTVDERNTTAINLYNKLGYLTEFFGVEDEAIEYA